MTLMFKYKIFKSRKNIFKIVKYTQFVDKHKIF